MNERAKTRLGLVVRLLSIAITVATLWWFLRGLDIDQLGAALRGVDYSLLGLAVLLNLGAQLVRAASWSVMLGPRHPVSLGPLVCYELAAQAASSLSPARAGEMLRLWLLKRDDVPASVTTALIVLKKVIGALGVALLMLPTPLLVGGMPGWLPGFAFSVCAAMVVLLVLLVWVSRRDGSAKVPKLLRGVIGGMYFLRDRRAFFVASAWILLGEATDALAAFVVLRALHVDLSFPAAVVVLFFIDFSNALPAAPGHLGTFEVGALYSLDFLQVPQSSAMAFALLFHAQQALPQIVFGLPFHLYFLASKRKQAPSSAETKTTSI